MRSVLFLCLIVAAATYPLSIPDTQEEREIAASYMDYLKSYERDYDHDEMYQRFVIYRQNIKQIVAHNNNDEDLGFQLGVTNFTDWTWSEFKANYLLSEPQNCSATNGNFQSKVSISDLPETKDWRKEGVLYKVKDQGSCGSCWTFSTTGSLEAHWALKTGNAPESLSEQQLVDCAQAFNNHGCNGGLPSYAFEYISYTGGLDTDASYPYTAKDGKCAFKSVDIGARVPGGSVNITQGHEEGIHEAVGSVGPVSIAFEVVNDFMHYTGGVYQSTACGNTSQDVNHAVVVVGYGSDSDDTPYWIVRNSWGEAWGLNGYFHIVKDQNMCGLAECASYPDVHGDNAIPYIKY